MHTRMIFGKSSAIHCLPLILLAISASGCGGKPALSSVEGRVSLDGKPLAGALVEFQPEHGSPSYGDTEPDGHFRLRFNRTLEGALTGKHIVRVRTAKHLLDAAGEERLQAESLPPKYNDASELVRNVESGANQIDIELQSAPSASR